MDHVDVLQKKVCQKIPSEHKVMALQSQSATQKHPFLSAKPTDPTPEQPQLGESIV